MFGIFFFISVSSFFLSFFNFYFSPSPSRSFCLSHIGAKPPRNKGACLDRLSVQVVQAS